MKQFVKATALAVICTYAVVAFCAWDITWVASCHAFLRIFFAIWCLSLGIIGVVYPK